MPEQNHIMILSDNDFDEKILRHILSSYQLSFYRDIDILQRKIKKQLPHLLMIDSNFDQAGFNLCKILLRDPVTSTLPILFMFDQLTREGVTSLFESGGSDYVTKPFNQFEVISRIHIHINHAKEKQKLDFLAHYDPMSHTYNRRSFFEKAQQMMKVSAASKKKMHLILFHLSTLFDINENYGHFTGDKIIEEFAQLTSKELSQKGIIGRLNGNDFAVMFDDEEHDTTRFALAVIKKADEISIDDKHPLKVDYAIAKRYQVDESIDDLLLEASKKLEASKSARTQRNY